MFSNRNVGDAVGGLIVIGVIAGVLICAVAAGVLWMVGVI